VAACLCIVGFWHVNRPVDAGGFLGADGLWERDPHTLDDERIGAGIVLAMMIWVVEHGFKP
jgi:hypothetical protein